MNIENVQQHLPDFSFDEGLEYVQPVKEYFEFYGLNFEDSLDRVSHCFGLIEAGDYQIASHYYKNKTNEDRKCVLIVHGLYDHTGLYKHLIKSCLLQGWDVLSFDLPGHGLSTGRRVSISNFEQYQLVLKDVAAYFSSVNIEVLIGQSTGAAIVMHYLLDYPQADLKAVLLAPLYKVYRWRYTKMLYQVLKRSVHKVPRRFGRNSHDEKFVAFLEHGDPLQYRYTYLDWVGALFEWVDGFKYFKANKSNVLIVQGDKDETVDWVNNLTVIKKKLPNAVIKEVNGAGHHLVNEIESIRDQVFSYVNQYLESCQRK